MDSVAVTTNPKAIHISSSDRLLVFRLRSIGDFYNQAIRVWAKGPTGSRKFFRLSDIRLLPLPQAKS
jgi:hypothetical protein